MIKYINSFTKSAQYTLMMRFVPKQRQESLVTPPPAGKSVILENL